MKLDISGQRVNLRMLKKGDALVIFHQANDPEISRFTSLPHPYALKRAYDFIKKTQQQIRRESAYELGIELKESGQIIGMMSLMDIDYHHKNARVGYWVGRSYWGQGFASEALGLILHFAFKKLKLHRVSAIVMHLDIPSVRVLEKAGFKLEGRLRKANFENGVWVDDLLYAILREEYEV
jgi:RimJ/RimL family protein N-acetyltransferase